MEHSNKPRGKVSVCMATFNGAPFIREQVNSILSQLGSKDEIVVSDDGSTDYTLAILESYHDSRIKILNHKERKNNPWKAWGGDKKCYLVSKNFNNALLHCTGDFIFLSDQDDVWLPGRVDKMVEVMEKNPDSCVVCNSVLIDMLGKVISGPLRRNGCSLSLFRQLKCPMFSGCTMAFDALFRKRVVPMPAYIPSHDAFIGLSALVVKRLFLIDETLHLYRSRDGANTSSSIHSSAVFKIAYRAYLMYAIYARLLKRRFLT